MQKFFRKLVPLAKRMGTREHHPDPTNMMHQTKGWKAAVKEATIPTTKYEVIGIFPITLCHLAIPKNEHCQLLYVV